MNIARSLQRIALLALAPVLPLAAQAAGWTPDGVFAQAGFAPSHSHSITAGALWQWDWQGRFGNALATGMTEVYLSRWSAHGDTVTQAALVPLVRLRLDHGRSPWFLEGGIGVSVMDDLYRNHGKQFSTRFNFVDVLAAGRSLGPDGRHEVSLRLAHFSNANIRKPNPGESFLQLRYTAMF
jgi:lipid A 3-O-deacylase